MSAHQQLLYHIVFSTKERRLLLQDDEFREHVWSYMAGVTTNLGGHALRIGGYFDHAHLLLRIPAKIAVSDFVGKVKANTSKHINESRDTMKKFHWQDGYGAFTVSRSQVDAVTDYIDRQMEHHRKRSFQEEFLKMLVDHEVEYDPKYADFGGLRHRQGCFGLRPESLGRPKGRINAIRVFVAGYEV